jgi:hypothetical protein
MDLGQINAIMAQEPTLTTFGFGIYSGYRRESPEKRAEIFRGDRQALIDEIDRVQATCEWIDANLYTRKSINPYHTSYGLKHIAERDIGYITNGVFIAAMIACGYRYRVDGPNAVFNVSEWPIKRAYKRLNNHVY